MKINKILIAIVSSLVLISCANKTEQKTTVVVATTIPTTTTTLDLGDCSEYVDTRWEAEYDKYFFAYNNFANSEDNKDKNFQILIDSVYQYRHFLRQLNVPFIKTEQNILVSALADYWLALETSWETKDEYRVTLTWMAWSDAENDFRNKWNPLCDDDYPYPEDIINGEPSNSDYQYEPYEGYNDGIDQDCTDIDRRVYVGDYDPDDLDRDGDGWGCES